MGKYIKNILFSFVLLAFVGCGQRAAFDLKAQSEGFAQSVVWNTKVDIIWVQDNSGSMAQHQSRIASQIDYFMDKLNSTGLDYHLAVTTTDMGKYGEKGAFIGANYKVITRGTPNAKGELANNIVLAGDKGASVSRGLDAGRAALAQSISGAAGNAGFYRADALLAIIYVSDENDMSADDSAKVISDLNTMKPNFATGQRGWIANFIGVTELTGACRTFNDYASPGYKYMDVATYSGGVNDTICTTDLSSALTNMKARIIEILTEYHLGFEPDLSTLVVRINGQIIPMNATNGYTYDPNGYVIRFHGNAVPPVDAIVNIDYKPKKN